MHVPESSRFIYFVIWIIVYIVLMHISTRTVPESSRFVYYGIWIVVYIILMPMLTRTVTESSRFVYFVIWIILYIILMHILTRTVPESSSFVYFVKWITLYIILMHREPDILIYLWISNIVRAVFLPPRLRRCTAKGTSRCVRSSKTHISLRIRAGWSESSMSALWIAKGSMFLQAESEASDQIVWMCRMIWILALRICQLVRYAGYRLS